MKELRELAQKLLAQEWGLNRVLAHGDVPEQVGHLLACDCASYVLQRERDAGREPQTESWEAVEIKRLWLEGLASDEECHAAFLAAREVAMVLWQEWFDAHRRARDARASRWEAARIAKDAAQLSFDEVLWAARGPTPQWQTRRLLWLCEVWEICGDRTPFLIREGTMPIPEPD